MRPAPSASGAGQKTPLLRNDGQWCEEEGVRIAIVDDLEPAMQAIRRTLAAVPEYEVVWIAHNGLEAVERCAQDTPDLIIMDLVMPEMDGAEATRQIMQQSPCAVLVTAASVGDRAGKAFEAMGAGALDAVNTPSIGADDELVGADRLLDKIAMLSKLIRHGDGISRTRIASRREKRPAAPPPMVVIGSSAGGPMALATVLSVLPADFGASVVIVQHVDEEFRQVWPHGSIRAPSSKSASPDAATARP